MQAACASLCGLCSGGFFCTPFRFGSCLFKDTHDFGFQLPEIHAETCASRMKNQIASGWEQIRVAAQDLAHAALDTIALVRLAQHFSCSQSNARCGWRDCGIVCSHEPAHRSGLPLSARRVGALIVGVLAQAQMRHRLTDNGFALGKCVVVSLMCLIHGIAAESSMRKGFKRISAATSRQRREGTSRDIRR